MAEKFEEFLKRVYQRCKRAPDPAGSPHPDEEDIACFIEGRLSPQRTQELKEHFAGCSQCADILAASLRAIEAEAVELPAGLEGAMRKKLESLEDFPILEIILRMKERFFEVLGTSGDILVGQELVPEPILRSRAVKDFKDEIMIMKEFKDARVEVKLECKAKGEFALMVAAQQKNTQKPLKGVRITLIRQGLELESYLADSGAVTFDHVTPGKYSIEMVGIEEKLAKVVLEVNI
jgi:hypothetical protein